MFLPVLARPHDIKTELLLRGQRMAAHARSDRRGGYSTVEAHMPAAHRAHMEWTSQRLIDWGQRIGPACGELSSNDYGSNRESSPARLVV